jgi:hypothetical protein
VEVLFPLKDPQHRERICNEILASYLADTRKARILGSDGSYSRPRAVRNGHAFSVQEHLMHLAEGTADTSRSRVLRTPGVVYNPTDVTAAPNIPADESDTQDTSNAAV